MVLNGLSVNYCNHNLITDELNALNKKFLSINWNALVMASIGEYSEKQYIEQIMKDSLFFKSSTKNNKYKTIKQYEVEKYKYQPHYIKK